MPEPAGGPPRRRATRLLATRLLTAGLVMAAGLVLGAGLAFGVPAPARAGDSAADGGTPRTLCRLTDPRVPELSGLVALDGRMVAINDGGDRLTVYELDRTCRVVDVRTGPVDPFDPEDLAVGADGTLWLADTGDNRTDRPTVALLALRTDGSTGVYRMTYPDGPHDAEALLLAPDGTPYVVTKEVLGASGVYRPTGALVEDGTVALERVASVDFTLTGTPGGPVGRAGQLMVTGGAVSPDGRRLALRTYTDAYVWALSGSDVPAALSGTPVRIALPPAPQGEAISFTADGTALLVAGEGLPGDVTLVPIAAATPSSSASAASSPAASPTAGPLPDDGPGPFTVGLIAAAAAIALVWLGTRVFRRRAR